MKGTQQRPSVDGGRSNVATLLGPLVLAVGLAATTSPACGELVVADGAARVTSLIDDMPAAGGLAAPATGQAVYIVDEAARSVIGCDPFRPERRWTAIEPLDGGEQPAAIACIDSSTLAVLCGAADAWTLRTFRLPAPGAATVSASARTTHAVGPAAGGIHPQVTVGFSRDWLVVNGLAAPAAAVIPFAIHGAKPTPLPIREQESSRRPLASAGTPADELVLFESDAARHDATAVLTIRAVGDVRPLLALETGLPGVRAAACSRSSGDLWVLAGSAGSDIAPEGLWRIEATIRDRRQAIRAVCIARLDAPRSLVWISDRMILAVHGREARRVVHVDPSAPATPAAAKEPMERSP